MKQRRYERRRNQQDRLWRKRRAHIKAAIAAKNRGKQGMSIIGHSPTDESIPKKTRVDNAYINHAVNRMKAEMRKEKENHQQHQAR